MMVEESRILPVSISHLFGCKFGQLSVDTRPCLTVPELMENGGPAWVRILGSAAHPASIFLLRIIYLTKGAAEVSNDA
jgi:hypothetical protein